jgi:hypothetical protein
MLELGVKVLLGDSGRVAKIGRVQGVGRNVFTIKAKYVERELKGEVLVLKIVVSCLPNEPLARFIQRIALHFIGCHLKSMKDFVV